MSRPFPLYSHQHLWEFAVKEQLEKIVSHMYGSGIRYSQAVGEFQTAFILTVLREQKGNQVRAAQKLGMHRNTLRRVMRKLGLDISSYVPAPVDHRSASDQSRWRRRPERLREGRTAIS